MDSDNGNSYFPFDGSDSAAVNRFPSETKRANGNAAGTALSPRTLKKAEEIKASGRESLIDAMERTRRVDPVRKNPKGLSPLDRQLQAFERIVTRLLPQFQGISSRVLKGEKCNALVVGTLAKRLTELGKLGVRLRTRVPQRKRSQWRAAPKPA